MHLSWLSGGYTRFQYYLEPLIRCSNDSVVIQSARQHKTARARDKHTYVI